MLCGNAFSQEKEKVYLSDSIEGWFRFDKNRHSIRFFAGLNAFERRVEGAKNAYMYAPSVTIGYGYTPIKRWLVNFDFIYEYSFNSPHYDHQSLNYHFNLGHVLWGRNRFFMLPGVDFHAKNYIYTIHPDLPERTFFNDSVVNVRNSHYLFQLRPNINFGLNLWNNMTVQVGVGYNLILDRPAGNLPTAPITFNINFAYFLPQKNTF